MIRHILSIQFHEEVNPVDVKNGRKRNLSTTHTVYKKVNSNIL